MGKTKSKKDCAGRGTDSLGFLTGAWSSGDRRALEKILSRVRFGRNKLKEITLYSMEIAGRDSIKIREVLEDRKIEEILADTDLNPPQKGDRIRRWLFKKRFPRISRHLQRYQDLRNKISWPDNIQVNGVDILEENTHRVTFEFRNLDELENRLEKLHDLALDPNFKKLFEDRKGL
jgi:hypothetical protein